MAYSDRAHSQYLTGAMAAKAGWCASCPGVGDKALKSVKLQRLNLVRHQPFDNDSRRVHISIDMACCSSPGVISHGPGMTAIVYAINHDFSIVLAMFNLPPLDPADIRLVTSIPILRITAVSR